MLLLVVAAVLRLTLPAFDALGCYEASPVPLRDLDSLFVFARARYADSDSLVYARCVRGLEGQEVAFELAIEWTCSVWAVTSDLVGNRSCPSNFVGLNVPAAVEPGESARDSTEFFDVSGRRVRHPLPPGVYFRRRAGVVSKTVVLR